MNSRTTVLNDHYCNHVLKDRFIKWQCHIRQIMMRDLFGKPTDGIMPELYLENGARNLGAVITIMNKLPSYSQTPEMLHIARRTHDPAQRRNQALQYFASTYYQKYSHFSDTLTSTFQGGSKVAKLILGLGSCTLIFEAYSQKFELKCAVAALDSNDPIFKATLAHNRLFNPGLPADTLVLGFTPNWNMSSAEP